MSQAKNHRNNAIASATAKTERQLREQGIVVDGANVRKALERSGATPRELAHGVAGTGYHADTAIERKSRAARVER